MPLTDRHKHLLHEIYSVPYTITTVLTSGISTVSPVMFDLQRGIKAQLLEAIALIDADESIVARIDEILEEYDNWALDYSTIDREGYSMRPNSNERRVHQALYPYTGILFSNRSNSNKIKLG